jgi:hypothetical protein
MSDVSCDEVWTADGYRIRVDERGGTRYYKREAAEALRDALSSVLNWLKPVLHFDRAEVRRLVEQSIEDNIRLEPVPWDPVPLIIRFDDRPRRSQSVGVARLRNNLPAIIEQMSGLIREVDRLQDYIATRFRNASAMERALTEWVSASDAPASSANRGEASVWLARYSQAEDELRKVARALPKAPLPTVVERAQQLERPQLRSAQPRASVRMRHRRQRRPDVKHLIAIFIAMTACGDSPLDPPPPVDQSCDLHVSTLESKLGPNGWVRMSARAVYTCSRGGIYPASIRVFDAVDHFPANFVTEHSTYALCNSVVDFEFYTFPEDVAHLAVDAFMEVPPSTSPDLEKGLYCESAEYPWRSDL